MSGQTVLITGASRGLGAATARAVAQLGANVALTARSEADLIAVAQAIRSTGGRALSIVADVSQPIACQRMVSETVAEFGTIDAVVNNAGIVSPIALIADGDPEGWRESWAVNVLGPVMVTQAALPYLRQQKGRVINVSSGAAIKVMPGWAAYCVAKAALNHFTRILAEEEPEVTTLALRPGIVDTAMQTAIRRQGAAGMPADVYARFVRYHEEGELLPPEVPACALAILALYAPPDWSGAFLPWDNEEIQSLVRRFGCNPGPGEARPRPR